MVSLIITQSAKKLGILGLYLAIIGMGLLSAVQEVAAQTRPPFLRVCPYRADTWPFPESNTLTCPPAARPNGASCPNTVLGTPYRYKAHQDCCGALPICRIQTVSYSVRDPRGDTASFQASICGQGCRPGEIPNGTTCLVTGERQTSWFVFEARPIPGGGRNFGDPAGYLRFRIFPCDVPPNNAACDGDMSSINCNCDTINPYNFCGDNGFSSIGSTDYDWIIYDISRTRTRTQSCRLISDINGNRTPVTVFSCNYSGLSGGTGMSDVAPFGLNDQPASGGRYNGIRPVTVGQRFILAVDGFSASNLKGYKIDFSGACFEGDPQRPTANIIPVPVGSKLDTIYSDTNYCATGNMQFKFDYALEADSIQPRKFKVRSLDRPDDLIAVTDIISANAGDTSSLFNLFISPAAPGRYRLYYTDTIYDFCGNRFISDSIDFKINRFLTAERGTKNEVMCASDPSTPAEIQAVLNRKFGFNRANIRTGRNNVPNYQWKLIYLNNRGNTRNDLIGQNTPLVLGAMRANFKSIGNDTTIGMGLTIRDTTSEAVTGNTNLILHGFRCIVTFPVNAGSEDNPLLTGCQDSVDFEVAFKPTPSATVSASGNTCVQGTPITLTATTLPSSNRTLTWSSYASSTAASPLETFATGATYTAPNTAYTSQYYRVTVVDSTNGIACKATYPPLSQPAVSVTVAAQIASSFTYDIQNTGTRTFPTTITYKSTSRMVTASGDSLPVPAELPLVYEWSFDDGSPTITTNESTISRTYDRPNSGDSLIVTTTLRAYDPMANTVNRDACTFPSNPATVIVALPFFPNVLLPNDGDPRNDFLRFQQLTGNYKLEIYNRWGNLVYSTEQYNNDWTGKDVPAGVYYYVATDRESNAPYKGWLQLIK